MSERRACKAIGCSRMTIRYTSTRPDDGALREPMRELARERRRFGYRRLHVLLKREGYIVNHKKLFRLYREEKLMVGRRKRAIGTRAPMLVPLRPNERCYHPGRELALRCAKGSALIRTSPLEQTPPVPRATLRDFGSSFDLFDLAS
jgi:transposase InsO family protein